MYKNLLLDWALSRMIPHDHQLEGFQVVSWLTFLKDLLSNKISFLYYFFNSLFFLFFICFRIRREYTPVPLQIRIAPLDVCDQFLSYVIVVY